jgi:hypothetical protein
MILLRSVTADLNICTVHENKETKFWPSIIDLDIIIPVQRYFGEQIIVHLFSAVVTNRR